MSSSHKGGEPQGPPTRYTADPSHLAQLRKYLARDKDLKPEARATYLKALQFTEHFVFTAVPDVDEEIIASANAMREADVWRLPYDTCTFEFTAKLTMARKSAFGGLPFRFIAIVANHDSGPAIIGAFIKARDDANGSWILSRWHHTDPETGEEVPMIYYDVRPRDMTAEINTVQPISEEKIDFLMRTGPSDTETDVINCVASCMVMLATKGIAREKWIGNKPVLKNRPVPENAYTRVMVAEAAEAGHGHAVAGERYRVRLHLRRGHVRQQPHGPGRKFTRKIWIEPRLVGYAEEGRITHDHYEAYPA